MLAQGRGRWAVSQKRKMAFDIYRETEIQSSVLMKCSIKEELFNELSSSFSLSNLLFMF